MNKKITAVMPNSKVNYCILDGNTDTLEQMKKVLHQFGRGYEVRVSEDAVSIVDIYHQDPIAIYKILSTEDSDEQVSLSWMDIDNQG